MQLTGQADFWYPTGTGSRCFAEMTRPHIRYSENRGILVTVNADRLAGVRLSRRGRSGRR